jgi:hypothetical protein
MSERADVLLSLQRQGISLVPRIRGTKDKYPFRYTEFKNGTKKATEQDLLQWTGLGYDLAAISGINKLVVLDFDSESSYLKFWDKKIVRELPKESLTVRTSRGYSNWFFDDSMDPSGFADKLDARPILEMEIFLNGHLAACPGNLHPSGVLYEAIDTLQVLKKNGLVEQAIERLVSLGWTRPFRISGGVSQPGIGSLDLSESEFLRLQNALSELWFDGQHHAWIVGVTGWFLRAHISEEATTRFIVNVTGRLGCKKSCWKEAPTQVRALYRAAQNSPTFRVPGISSLIRLAAANQKHTTIDNLRFLNAKFQTMKSVEAGISEWMNKNGF